MQTLPIALKNDGTVNKNRVTVGDLTLYFSYETVIAFEHPTTGTVASQNIWSQTTGRYLNEIEPDKDKRVENIVFENKLALILKKGLKV